MEELIARGGMGEVHRAYDTQHDRVVAIKLLGAHLADDAEFRRRFDREARAAARLREPHVIPIHAYGEIDGRLYLDMRLVDGEDLSAALAARGPMSPSAAVDVIGQVAGALDAAHAEGLVHRDVKPSNVLIDAGGFVYLVDFGIARSMAKTADITRTGIPIGTVAYMAPERLLPDGRVDHRSDVYSLACLLFQCLAGAPPFPDENPLALMQAHLNREPPTLTGHRPDVSPAFDHVIATGMAKRPEERYESATALASAARFALRQPPATKAVPGTHPMPVPARQRRAPRRNRGWLVGAALAGSVVLAAAAALIWLPQWRGDETANQGPTTTAPSGTKLPDADLSVSAPLSTPDCDGSYLLIVGSAVDPSKYGRDVQAFLDANPDANYLHAPTTGCHSLRHRLDDADIYAVYYGPFPDIQQACDKRAVVGGESFVRRLDGTSSPERTVSCG
ncbi:serine/threonine-protein kinase [Actinophytocola glycyrrhizae]|uniref:non-specific serine/threonine protein kinase n=1 Tax=Actinophytocola glycyrrhizae TaxID=2044873 RepID=A0ABV9RWP2_9PSEU